MHTSFRSKLLLFSAFFIVLAQCKNPEKEAKNSAEIFKSYKNHEGANIIVVPPGLVSIFLDTDQPGNKEIKEILNSIDKLTFLVIPNRGNVKESNCFADLDRDFSNINFQDLAMVNNGKEIIKVKAYGDSIRVDELIVLVSNYDALFCVSFIGKISMESIVNLTKPENMVAVSNLKRLSR